MKRPKPKPGCQWELRLDLPKAERALVSAEAWWPSWATVDEFLMDNWLHIERLSTNEWFIGLGDTTMWVTVRKGKAKVTYEEQRK